MRATSFLALTVFLAPLCSGCGSDAANDETAEGSAGGSSGAAGAGGGSATAGSAGAKAGASGKGGGGIGGAGMGGKSGGAGASGSAGHAGVGGAGTAGGSGKGGLGGVGGLGGGGNGGSSSGASGHSGEGGSGGGGQSGMGGLGGSSGQSGQGGSSGEGGQSGSAGSFGEGGQSGSAGSLGGSGAGGSAGAAGIGGVGGAASGSGGSAGAAGAGGAAPTCSDGMKNGKETDVDCGGGQCPPCAVSDGCKVASDCVSNGCVNGACVPSSCVDGMQDGNESDVDCGGSDCPACENLMLCGSNADCVSGQCATICRPWVAVSGQSGLDHVDGVAIDREGNTVLIGDFASQIDLGGGTLSASGSGSDSFLAKFTREGALTYSEAFSSPDSPDQPMSIVLDANDGPAVTGSMWGGNYGGMQAMGYSHESGVVYRAASGGAITSAIGFGGPDVQGISAGLGVAVDANGDSYVVGRCRHTFGFEVSMTTVDCSEGMAFAARVTAAGTIGWLKTYGAASVADSAAANAVVVDGSDVYVGGQFVAKTDFGLGTMTPKGGTDGFLLKLSASDGHVVWARDAGGAKEDAIVALAGGNGAPIYVAGTFTSSDFQYGKASWSSKGGVDAYLAAIDGTLGDPAWEKPIGTAGDDSLSHLAVSGTGDLYAGGSFPAIINLGDGPTLGPASVIARFTALGGLVGTRATYGDCLLHGIAVNAKDANVVAVGEFVYSGPTCGYVTDAMLIAGEDLFVTSLGTVP